jgi:hypothetical protein
VQKNKENIKGIKKYVTKCNSQFSIDTCKKKHISFHPKDFNKSFSLAELDVIDTTEGCVLYDDNGNEVCILIPRKKALSRKGKKAFKKHLSLMKLLMKEEKGVERSKARKGIAEKEVAVGLKTNRVGHGYVESSLKKKNPTAWKTVCKYARQTEHVASEFIKEGLLVGHNRAKDLIGWSSLESAKIFNALSVSCNYYSRAHVDADFFFSVFQIIVDSDDISYSESGSVVQHFCFPTTGYAVAVRNGDMLLFNPSVYHCLSQKEKSFQGKDVFVNSFYLKSNIVGLHNNEIPFHEK